SASTLSQFMAGKYPGDSTKVRARLVEIMDRETEKTTLTKKNPDFIETSVSKRFFEIAKMSHLFCEIGVCYSDAGLGKTESAREYALRNGDCILIEADPSFSAGVMLRELHSRLYNDRRKDLHTTFTDCIDRLKNTGRLLIIDEAEKLPYRALEFVRRIHDKANIGILLTGMSELLGNLKGIRGQYAQLWSRVGMTVKLDKITEKDTENIISRLIPGSESLCKVFHQQAAGNTRRLFKLIQRSMHIADINEAVIDTDVITRAAQLVKIEVMS
ncbi:MAG TPA: AAA family ATPase, partial [Candidatus Bathyarchaeia archaeon]|nr:AAA family ATPase [Candidatus Bathyarchaeia archaeon]